MQIIKQNIDFTKFSTIENKNYSPRWTRVMWLVGFLRFEDYSILTHVGRRIQLDKLFENLTKDQESYYKERITKMVKHRILELS